jgi:hypothetical protein
MRSLMLFALVACGGPTAPLSGKPSAAPIPTGPAPTVDWAKDGHTTGLPAIAADGSVVVMGIIDRDGARGFPNFVLVVKDRNDATTTTTWVLKADESEKLVTESGPTPELAARIAAANRQLADLHGNHALVPIAQLAVDGERVATGQGLTVGFTERTVAVTRNNSEVLTKPTPAGWLAKDGKMCPTCTEICHNPAFLAGAWASAERSVAILEVSYKGTDTCWEPASEYHVVAW